MITLFRSKYRTRIEMKILKLKMSLSEVSREKEEYKKLKQTQKVCGCWVREREIEQDINLLKEILKPQKS